MMKPLPIGKGLNGDIDDTTAADGTSVALVNVYQDRAGAYRTLPSSSLFKDPTGTTGAGSAYIYHSKFHSLVLYIVNGTAMVQTESDGTLTEITGASLTSGIQPVFAEDGQKIFFAANSAINVFDPGGSTITQLGGNAPTGVTGLAFIGGYLIATGTIAGDTLIGFTHYSDDGPWGVTPPTGLYSTWESYNNESNPDAAVALVTAWERIYNIGTQTIEVTYIDGDVPISVDKNASQPIGTVAPYSVSFDKESIYLISEIAGTRKIVRLLNGGAPQPIDIPVSLQLDQFDSVSDARAFVMAFRGHNFYVVTFPSANIEFLDQTWEEITLAYHLQTGEWSILAGWDEDHGVFTASRFTSFCYVEMWGKALIGLDNGQIYEFTDLIVSDYTADPTFTHRWRNEDQDWTLPRTISLGKVGDRSTVKFERQIGQYRSRQHEFVYYQQGAPYLNLSLRALIRTGHITYGTGMLKKGGINGYMYDLKRGSGEFIINGIQEDSVGGGR